MIHDHINVLRIGISRLLRNVEELPVQFERMDVDEYKSPEEIARLVRAAWQVPYGPIRNLVAVVEAAGGIVVQCSFGTRQLDAVSQWPRGMAPLFFVNTDNPVDRWRYTLAHEVGHIIMHRIPTSSAEEEAAPAAPTAARREEPSYLDGCGTSTGFCEKVFADSGLPRGDAQFP